MLPLVADYVDHDSKGRAIALNGLLLAGGLSLSTFFINTHTDYSLSNMYWILFLTVLVLGGLVTWMLKPGKEYYRIAVGSPDKHIDTTESEMTVNLQGGAIRQGKWALIVQTCKLRPWIMVAYLFAFMNGIGMAICGQNLNLYIQSFDIENGVEIGSQVVLKAYIATLVTSFVVGPILDFVDSIYIAGTAFTFNIFAFMSIWAVEDPESGLMSIIAMAIGAAYALSLLLASYLGFKHYPPSMRGFLFSIANVFMVMGTIVTTVVGGILAQDGDKNWPFYLGGISSLISFFIFVLIYMEIILPTKRKIKKKQELDLSLLYTSIQTGTTDDPTVNTKLQFDD